MDISEPASVPYCSETWTRFFDLDDPTIKGDYELINSIRNSYPEEVCASPLAVDARAIGTYSHYPIAGQTATLNVEDGFMCVNSEQHYGNCLDYEIRFCCPEGRYNMVIPNRVFFLKQESWLYQD